MQVGGAVLATAGCILPSCILVTLLAKLYLRYRKMDLLQGILANAAVYVYSFSRCFLFKMMVFLVSIQKTQIDMVIIFIAAVYLIQFFEDEPGACYGFKWPVAKLGIYCSNLPFVMMYRFGNL